MSTTTSTATQPSRKPVRRRTLVSVAVVAALAVGGGVAATGVLSSDGSTSRQADPTPTVVATKVDVPALWDELSILPANDRDNIVAGLNPDVRARLAATAEGLATAAAHH